MSQENRPSKRVIRVRIAIILFIILFAFIGSANQFDYHGIKSEDLSDKSLEMARENKITSPKIIGGMDDGNTIIEIVATEKNPDKYSVLMYNKSIFFNRYKLVNSEYKLNFNERYNIQVSNTREMYNLTFSVDEKDLDVDWEVINNYKKPTLSIRLTTTAISTLVFGIMFYLIYRYDMRKIEKQKEFEERERLEDNKDKTDKEE